jgi:long-chain acyl-CoA synthetase
MTNATAANAKTNSSMTITLSRNSLFALVTSLVSAELGPIRHHEFDASAVALWRETMSMDGGGLEMDSIELMQVSGVVDEFFHLHETGLEEYLLRDRSLGGWCDILQQAFLKGHRRFTFRTSGSQGLPKPSCHRAVNLMEETAQLARIFGGRQRVVSLVAPHHIYGFLFSMLLPQALNVAVVAGHRWPIAKILRRLAPGDLVIGYPLIWQQLQQRARRLPQDVQGVTSTAPCDPGIIQSLRHLGISRMTEVYGSSETGGIGYRHDFTRSYRLFEHWQRVPVTGKEVMEFALKRGKSKAIFAPDILAWSGARSFRPTARRDGAVQVAGINVYPNDVARRLREHPAIQDCAVRLMRPNEGDRLKAYICLKENYNTGALQASLEKWIFEQFKAPDRPVAITFGSGLPVTSAGKLSDW